MALSLPDGRPETKYQAWRLESSQASVTRFLAAPGLTSLVCDGAGHAEASVPRDIATSRWRRALNEFGGTA